MKDMISTVVADYIAPSLKANGFKKQNMQWNRKRAGFIDVVTLQEASYSTSVESVFTLNIGVSVPAFVEATWSRPMAGFATEAECAVRVRLGDLLQGKIYGDAIDQWWKIESQDRCETVGGDVSTAIKNYALPFFNRINDYESIADHLRRSSGWLAESPFHVICCALSEAKSNRKSEALARLETIRGKAWKTKIPQLQTLILDSGE